MEKPFRKHMKVLRVALLPLPLLLGACASQTPVVSATAPVGDRGQFLREWAETQGYSLGQPVAATPTPDGKQVLFLRSGARDRVRRLYELDVSSGQERELITPEALLGDAEEKLSPAEKALRERMRLTAKGFASFELSHDGKRVILPLSGRLYALDRTNGKVRTLYEGKEAAFDPKLAPDGSRLAYVKGHDLYVRDLASGKERRLTTGGSEELSHGRAEFVAQEEMSRYSGFWWSPDSRALAYQETDHRGMERFAVGDAATPEAGAEFFYYPRPGKANAKVRLGIIAATGGRTVWVKWDAKRYPYLARIVWEEKKAPLSLLVQSRDQRDAAFVEVNPATGSSKLLYTDHDDAWLNLSDSTPRWLPDGSGILAMRESDGARELVLHARNGDFKRVLVPGKMRFLEVMDVVESTGEIYALATPRPTEVQLLRTSVTAEKPELLHSGIGERRARVARQGAVYLLEEETLDKSPTRAVYSRSGERLVTVKSVAESPAQMPNVELRMVAAGGREFQAAVIRPRSFDPKRRYPVIDYVYGGPGVNRVLGVRDKYLQPQWFADQGAIVVMADNRGEPRRDRAWERSIEGSFGEIPLQDQVAVLKALAAELPQMDLQRLGIYGWSFGGYMSALAVMKQPELFKVGVAGAPVTEWRDYDTHYTERYLRTPEVNAAGYDGSSLLPLAAQLKRPLMLVHGTGDDNVYFFHSLKLADALFKAGKPFQFLPLVSFTHMVPEPLVQQRLYTRMADFMFAELGGPQ